MEQRENIFDHKEIEVDDEEISALEFHALHWALFDNLSSFSSLLRKNFLGSPPAQKKIRKASLQLSKLLVEFRKQSSKINRNNFRRARTIGKGIKRNKLLSG